MWNASLYGMIFLYHKTHKSAHVIWEILTKKAINGLNKGFLRYDVKKKYQTPASKSHLSQ